MGPVGPRPGRVGFHHNDPLEPILLRRDVTKVGWGFTKATRLNLAVGKMQMWRGLPMDGCVVEPKMAGRHEHVSRMASSL